MPKLFVWLFFFSLSGLAGSFPAPAVAQDVDCSALDDLNCVRSAQCMFVLNDDKQGTQCIAPWNRCQIGFQQDIGWPEAAQDTAARCEARAGCAFVPAGQCYCPPGVECVCGGGSPPDCAPDTTSDVAPPVGRFVVVDVRAASGVASGALTVESNPLGKLVDLSETGFKSDGIDCEKWEISRTDLGAELSDPLLADVMVGPADTPQSAGDKRIVARWEYVCEGEVFTQVLQVDPRVIVISWQNGTKNLIAEIPLTPAEIRRVQAALANMKFLDHAPTGQLDEATLSAIGHWAEYRAASPEPYRFSRVGITLNLLDTLGVFK